MAAGDKQVERCTHSFRYLQIIPATFSQFFFVGQKTKHECRGMTSVTRAMMWSGSIFCMELEYCRMRGNQISPRYDLTALLILLSLIQKLNILHG